MTITIPVWFMWCLGIPLAIVLLLLMILGAYFLYLLIIHF